MPDKLWENRCMLRDRSMSFPGTFQQILGTWWTGDLMPSPVHLCCVFQVSQQAMAPTHGGRAGSWKSAASRAATCGVWRCTALPPRPTSPARSATQTRQERPRPEARATKGTRARSVGQHSSRTRRKTKGWAAAVKGLSQMFLVKSDCDFRPPPCRDRYLDIVIHPSR